MLCCGASFPNVQSSFVMLLFWLIMECRDGQPLPWQYLYYLDPWRNIAALWRNLYTANERLTEFIQIKKKMLMSLKIWNIWTSRKYWEMELKVFSICEKSRWWQAAANASCITCAIYFVSLRWSQASVRTNLMRHSRIKNTWNAIASAVDILKLDDDLERTGVNSDESFGMLLAKTSLLKYSRDRVWEK